MRISLAVTPVSAAVRPGAARSMMPQKSLRKLAIDTFIPHPRNACQFPLQTLDRFTQRGYDGDSNMTGNLILAAAAALAIFCPYLAAEPGGKDVFFTDWKSLKQP